MASKARDAFRTISEVADWLDVPAHVLRFWESKFTQIKPVKRAGGRRYYRPQDMLLIGGIKKLLHDDGMTIRGVQKMLKEEGVKAISGLSKSLDGVEEASSPRTLRRKDETPDTEDAVDQTADTAIDDAVLADDQTAVDAWEADAKEDEAPAPEQATLDNPELTSAEEPEPEVEAASSSEAAPETHEEKQEEAVTGEDAEPEPAEDPMQDDDATETDDAVDDVPEAPFIEVEEEEPQLGGDNVVELPSRNDQEPEASLEAVAEDIEAVEPETTEQPTEEVDLAPELNLGPEAEAEAEAEAEIKTPHEPVTQARTDAPETEQEGYQPSDAQLAALALKRKLRGTDAAGLNADGIAPHVARLQALRDKLANQLGQ
ncbi:MerR family transcriptional regulator [Litoreibacter sp.]|uniref:MerR family transcriptional regulator n=1 Tax=Litoreibacter sp. TaxID=1969459 RepID=UPI0032990BA9